MPEGPLEPLGPFVDSNPALRELGRAHDPETSRVDMQLPRPFSMPSMGARREWFGELEEGLRSTSAPSTYFDNLPLNLSDFLQGKTLWSLSGSAQQKASPRSSLPKLMPPQPGRSLA